MNQFQNFWCQRCVTANRALILRLHTLGVPLQLSSNTIQPSHQSLHGPRKRKDQFLGFRRYYSSRSKFLSLCSRPQRSLASQVVTRFTGTEDVRILITASHVGSNCSRFTQITVIRPQKSGAREHIRGWL